MFSDIPQCISVIVPAIAQHRAKLGQRGDDGIGCAPSLKLESQVWVESVGVQDLQAVPVVCSFTLSALTAVEGTMLYWLVETQQLHVH